MLLGVSHRCVAAGTTGPARPTNRPFTRAGASARPRSVKASVLQCPYEALGVPPTADELQIKRAYRKLALQYHPDVNRTVEAERAFISIQQAYAVLTGKSPGPGREDPRHSRQHGNWAFHDWYWGFNETRRKAAQARAEEGPGDQQQVPNAPRPADKSGLQSQLAGLRHRAAIRNVKQQREAKKAAQQEGQQEEQQQQGQEMLYDTTEMSDGVCISNCSAAEGASDPWQGASAAPRKPSFTATEGHREQLQGQLAGLKRKARMKRGGGSTETHAAAPHDTARDAGACGAAA